jgi:Family of unknown function (DUF6527)
MDESICARTPPRGLLLRRRREGDTSDALCVAVAIRPFFTLQPRQCSCPKVFRGAQGIRARGRAAHLPEGARFQELRMKSRVDRIRLLPTVSSRDEAANSLRRAGDAALVVRGVPRMLLLRCPCGCGDDLNINLDGRSGPAWRHYVRRGALTLFPSYWRATHCESHFILWKNEIYWCDWDDYSYWQGPSELESIVLEEMPAAYVSYEVLADRLGELPWDVLKASYSLMRQGKVERHPDRGRGEFRKLTAQALDNPH